jgi:CTP synthase
MAIEYAKNVCGIKGATTEELGSSGDMVVKLSEKKVGGFYTLIKDNSFVSKIYKQNRVRERHRHTSEINGYYADALEKKGMKISGKGEDDQIDIIEVPNHPFYVGVQFHPEYTSRPLSPNPLLLRFVQTCKASR